MPIPSRKKTSAFAERDERLRRARADAQTLRAACPSATSVNVELQFLPIAAPPHAAQSFVLYPGARAFFEYPCPYGDCDGVYELSAEAGRTLKREKSRVTGVAKCGGVRSRDGLQRQPCDLSVKYTISTEYGAQDSG